MTEKLSPTQAAALRHARPNGSRLVLYRGGLDLEYGYVTRATIFALAARGLVEPKWTRVEQRSRAGLVYKGWREELDYAVLTDAGLAARATLTADTGSET